MSIQTLVWLFIVVFMLHDLEEIISVEPWLNRNRERVQKMLPRWIGKTDRILRITSAQFAFAVLLEFIVFIPFTYMAAENGRYFVFLAFNCLFLLHVFTHAAQSMILRRYTPGVVTAVFVVLPYTLYLIGTLLSMDLVTWTEVALSVPVGLLVVPIVMAGHELGIRLVK
ncbi:HXXEE domain-containing protein [Paenibacillus thailandensis]|uniref:HXXEE domain-containing protein n=1 Tax=Paenibacillus thailandensis TaxID=393250 RepID=A0ABW5QUM8_9BACL